MRARGPETDRLPLPFFFRTEACKQKGGAVSHAQPRRPPAPGSGSRGSLPVPRLGWLFRPADPPLPLQSRPRRPSPHPTQLLVDQGHRPACGRAPAARAWGLQPPLKTSCLLSWGAHMTPWKRAWPCGPFQSRSWHAGASSARGAARRSARALSEGTKWPRWGWARGGGSVASGGWRPTAGLPLPGA